MPYIKPEVREQLVESDVVPLNGGEINFLVTAIVNSFLMHKGLSYAAINEAVGALECAKQELYRRVAAPYEDTKIQTNGDVYSPGVVP